MKKVTLTLNENSNFTVAEESECFYFDDEISLTLTLCEQKIWLEQDSKSYEFQTRFAPLFTLENGTEYILFLGHGCHVLLKMLSAEVLFTVRGEDKTLTFSISFSHWQNWLSSLHDFFI